MEYVAAVAFRVPRYVTHWVYQSTKAISLLRAIHLTIWKIHRPWRNIVWWLHACSVHQIKGQRRRKWGNENGREKEKKRTVRDLFCRFGPMSVNLRIWCTRAHESLLLVLCPFLHVLSLLVTHTHTHIYIYIYTQTYTHTGWSGVLTVTSFPSLRPSERNFLSHCLLLFLAFIIFSV